MFNLYELCRKYNIEHLIAWEAYRLENNLTVKINPDADILFPFNEGDMFQFVSYSTYRPGKELWVRNISDQVRDAFQPKNRGVTESAGYDLYSSKIVEKIDLTKVIDLGDKNFNFDLLSFTLIGMPMFSELMIFMLQEISKIKCQQYRS